MPHKLGVPWGFRDYGVSPWGLQHQASQPGLLPLLLTGAGQPGDRWGHPNTRHQAPSWAWEWAVAWLGHQPVGGSSSAGPRLSRAVLRGAGVQHCCNLGQCWWPWELKWGPGQCWGAPGEDKQGQWDLLVPSGSRQKWLGEYPILLVRYFH